MSAKSKMISDGLADSHHARACGISREKSRLFAVPHTLQYHFRGIQP